MTDSLTIALAQLNPTVGDLPGNLEKLRQARRDAGEVDLVITPELSIAGYFPEDLYQWLLEAHSGEDRFFPEPKNFPA